MRELEAEVARRSRLLEEGQARWEAAAAERAARVMQLERRLAEVRTYCGQPFRLLWLAGRPLRQSARRAPCSSNAA